MELPHLAKFAEVRDKLFEVQKLRLMTMISDAVSTRQTPGQCMVDQERWPHADRAGG